MRFTEIEHKFVLDGDFDLAAFRRALEALGPKRVNTLQVRDRFHLAQIFRRLRKQGEVVRMTRL